MPALAALTQGSRTGFPKAQKARNCTLRPALANAAGRDDLFSEGWLSMPQFPEAQFLISAWQPRQFPQDEGSEVAFAGRSNAGKSSALNAITGRRDLARTSKTPGRTQLINFFALGPGRRLVDLPGYGYAKVP